MDDTFKIFVHRLKDGHQENIEEVLSPEFLEIDEPGLAFKIPVQIKGSAATVEETLVLRLFITTEAEIPCAICSSPVPYKLSVPDFCCTESLDNIKNGYFNFKEVLREAILLEVPYAVECKGGNCPERAFLAKYFSQQ